VRREVRAERAGRLRAIDTQGLGELVVELGGGRLRKEDAVDPRVGVVLERKLGDPVAAGDPLCVLDLAAADAAAARRCAALFTIGEEGPAPTPLVLETVE
jgi:thymidine phosphorylase